MSFRKQILKLTVSLCPLVVCLSLTGCREEKPVEFEPNLVHAKSIAIQSGYSMDKALEETQIALDSFFGTPDQPQLPEFVLEDETYSNLISMENLAKAAGPPTAKNTAGLYRKYCSTCHGVVGNGRGTTAALLDPYPRDYRMGKFKYKSTPRGVKPLKEDLAYSIKHGIAGTSMKSIDELELDPEISITDEDINALVDYVIYLSWRGELERSMLMEGEYIIFEDGEHLYLPGSEDFELQQELVEEMTLDIAESWLEAEERVKEVPEPGDVPVPETIEEVLTAVNSDGDNPIKQSVKRGGEVFQSEIAACAKCHGKNGYGDGQTQDYDDWTKEWTQRINVDPTDEDALVPLIARGALPPRKILPRDFREGLFRGGSEPEHIYRRIAEGIDGTPMPAAALPPEDIWHLVNYVRSFAPVEESDEPGEVEVAANSGGNKSAVAQSNDS